MLTPNQQKAVDSLNLAGYYAQAKEAQALWAKGKPYDGFSGIPKAVKAALSRVNLELRTTALLRRS